MLLDVSDCGVVDDWVFAGPERPHEEGESVSWVVRFTSDGVCGACLGIYVSKVSAPFNWGV